MPASAGNAEYSSLFLRPKSNVQDAETNQDIERELLLCGLFQSPRTAHRTLDLTEPAHKL